MIPRGPTLVQWLGQGTYLPSGPLYDVFRPARWSQPALEAMRSGERQMRRLTNLGKTYRRRMTCSDGKTSNLVSQAREPAFRALPVGQSLT